MLPQSAKHRFQFIELLGRGGTAEVARVLDRQTGHEAALKYPLPDGQQPGSMFPELAAREYDLLGHLRYPGIVKILEAPGDRPDCLVMELCRGKTLDRIPAPVPIPKALSLLSAVAAALEFCRAVGIIHGDLKPSNIFLPQSWETISSDAMYHIRLSDFSLGKRIAEDDTARLGAGTIGYMAAETIRDERISHASDLFALGVIAYQLITGRHPFMHEISEPAAVNSRILEQSAPDPREIEDDISDDLAGLVMSMLSANEADRPDSAFEICLRLERMGAGYPFRRNLRPTCFLDGRESFEANLSRPFVVSEDQLKWLGTVCDGSVSKLHILLAANHSRGNLTYDRDQFSFEGRIYWPDLLRRRSLSLFGELTFAGKRRAVQAAVRESSTDRNESSKSSDVDLPPSTIRLLKHLLHPRTVRILSARYGPIVEAEGDPKRAVSIHIQAGNFEAAERCAQQAAIALQGEHRGTEAIGIVNRVIRYGDILDREYDCRSLLLLKGDLHKEQGENSKSQQAYQRVVAIYDQHEHDDLLARAHKSLGDLYRLKQDFTQAISSLNRAREIYEKLNHRLEVSHVLNNLGNTYWLTAQMDKAVQSYRLALRTQRDLKATSEVASTLNNIGNAYGAQGRHQRCIRVLNFSLELKKELGHAGEIARTLNNLGYAYYITGDMPAAVDCLSQSLTMNRRIGSKKEILFNLENLAAITIAAGNPKQALVNLAEGLSIADEVGDEGHQAVFYASEAVAHRRQGELGRALSSISRAEAISARLDSLHIDLNISLQQALIRYAVGDLDEALRLGRRIAADADRANDAEIHLSSLLLVTRLDDSAEFYERAKAHIADMHLVREARLLEFNRIEWFLGRELDDRLREAVDQVERMSMATGDDIEIPWMCNRLAHAWLELGDSNRAAGYVDKSLALSRQYELLPENADAHLLRGRLEYKFGEYEKSYADYKQSLMCHKKISDTLTDEQDRQDYQSKRSVRFLAVEIRRLHEKLAKRKGQV